MANAAVADAEMRATFRGHLFIVTLLLLFEVVVGTGVIGPSIGFVGAIVAGWRAVIWKPKRQHLVRVSVAYAVLGVGSFLVVAWNSDIARGHARTVIAAVERFHSEKGRYPETLQELIPEYLPTIPRPGFTWFSRSFGYNPQRPQLYFPAMVHGVFFYDFPTKAWLANE